LQSHSREFSRREDKSREMATEGHACDGKEIHQQQSKDAMDKELIEIRVRMEILAFQMQWDAKLISVYEWPMKTKEKWPVKELLARRQWRLLGMWLRHVESPRDDEEEMV
jgi:hypothetical protein